MNIMTKTSMDRAVGVTADLVVAVQYAVEDLESEEPPSSQQIVNWARAAFAAHLAEHPSIADTMETTRPLRDQEVTVRLVDRVEMTELNSQFRGKSSATNVLSFPAEMPVELIPQTDADLLGDIVICHSVVNQEARQQQKSIMDHYAHMVVHGVLHLCGYDHQADEEANRMEAMESKILMAAGIADPY
jgi:probable rRNA maturation factor